MLLIYKHSGVESNLYRAMHPEAAGWTLTNQLLAAVADTLRWIQWTKTRDGSKNRNMPDPIPRPGVKSNKRAVHPGAKGAPRSIARKLLGRKPLAPSDRSRKLSELFSKGTYGS